MSRLRNIRPATCAQYSPSERMTGNPQVIPADPIRAIISGLPTIQEPSYLTAHIEKPTAAISTDNFTYPDLTRRNF